MYKLLKKSPALMLSVITIIIITVISFWNIDKIFFQQDEWLGLGGVIQRQDTLGTWGSIAQVFNFKNVNEGIRFLPVTSILSHILYSNIGLNFPLYGVLALISIIICAVILNLVIQKITNSYVLSTLVSTLWVTNNLAFQAFTWIGTIVSSLVSTMFFLLSLYLLLLFNEKGKVNFFIASLLSVVVALFSKETSAFYPVIFILLIWFFFSKSFKLFNKLKLIVLILIPLAVSLLLPRLIFLSQGQSNFSPPIRAASNQELMYNSFLLPAKTLFHTFLSNAQIYETVYSVNRTFFGTQTDGFVVERIIGDAFSLLIAFYILLFISLALTFSTKVNRKLILFSLFSFFASTLPFTIFKGNSVIVEQRYYIYPAIFSSLLIVSVIYSLASNIKLLKLALTVLILIPVIIININGVKKMLDIDIKVGDYRRNILKTVSTIGPSLGSDNIFYFYTDHTGFYEFQSGFGQTLAVYLYSTGKIPKEVLTDRDYWDLSYEGFKSFDNNKFGYYMSYDKLLKTLQENKDISLSSVHSFYWDYQKHTVEDVSAEIREKLLKDLKNAKSS